jgi:hypothetical protein
MINSPYLRRNSVTELELPQIQNDYSLDSFYSETDIETLDGTLRTDVSFVKDGLIIKYDAVLKTDFIALWNFIRDAALNAQKMEFKFEKLSNYENYTEVKARIGNQSSFVGGSGLTTFYYSFDLIIKDVLAR